MSPDLTSPRGCLEYWRSTDDCLQYRLAPQGVSPSGEVLARSIVWVADGLAALASSGAAGERLRLVYSQRIDDIPEGAVVFPRCYHLLYQRSPRIVLLCPELAPRYEGLEAVTLEAGGDNSMVCLVFRRIWQVDGANRHGFVVATINNDGRYGFHVRVPLADEHPPVVKLAGRDYSWRFSHEYCVRDRNSVPGWDGAVEWLARNEILMELGIHFASSH